MFLTRVAHWPYADASIVLASDPLIMPLGPEDWRFDGGLCSVGNFEEPALAKFLSDRLAFAGIPSLVADQHFASAYPLLIGSIAGVRLLVPAEFVAIAEQTIAAFHRGEFDLGDDEWPIGTDPPS